MHFLIIMSHTNARYRSEENSPQAPGFACCGAPSYVPAPGGLHHHALNGAPTDALSGALTGSITGALTGALTASLLPSSSP